MSIQKQHTSFISNCIQNNIKEINRMMEKRPIDFRNITKGFKICILLEHNELVKWLYSRIGGIQKLGEEYVKNLIFIANSLERKDILLWLIQEYQKHKEHEELREHNEYEHIKN